MLAFHRTAIAAVLACTGLWGCTGDGLQTIEICGDVTIPDDVDALRVVIRDDTYAEKHVGVIDLAFQRRTLPTRTSIPGYAHRGYLSVQALQSGVEVARFDRLMPSLLVSDPIRAVINADCLHVSCSLGQTCVAGECVLAPDDRAMLNCAASHEGTFDGGVAEEPDAS